MNIITIEHLKIRLIDKIIATDNQSLLEALDNLISTNHSSKEIEELSEVQKELLKLSESDIEKGYLVSQESLEKRNLEWLNAM